MDFAGKVAMVTGASVGIGRAVALQLAQRGADLLLLDINEETLSQVCRELEAEGLPAPHGEEIAVEKEKSAYAQETNRPMESRDADVQAVYDAVERLEKRLNPPGVSSGDRLRVQRDLLLMQLEDLQLAARDVIQCCKDFIGSIPEERNALTPAFCEALAGYLSKLESCAG